MPVPITDGYQAIQLAVQQTAAELGIEAAEAAPVHEVVLEIRRRNEATYIVLACFIERHNAYKGFSRWYELRRALGPMDDFFEEYGKDLFAHTEDSRKVLLKHLYGSSEDEPARLLS
jgi:hypothetical protein